MNSENLDQSNGENGDLHMAMKVSRIYFQNHLKDPAAQDYIKTRSLSPAALRKFEIGYAPDQWRGLVDHFSTHRIRLAAAEAGVLTKAANSNRLLDFYRNRLMFPIRNHEGDLVGFGGRTLSKEEGVPKYINTPETSLFNKSELLFGLHQNKQAISDSGHAILVEGYMDVIALSAAGCHLACAPMGTALTDQQLQLLLDQGVKTLWICLDGDKAGQLAAERSIGVIMQGYDPRLEVKLITLPHNQDPDELVRSGGLSSFRDCMKLAEQLPDVIDRICRNNRPCESLEDKASYLMRLKPFIEQASGTLQNELLQHAAAVTGLSLSELKEATGYNAEDDQIDTWHRQVANAARIILHFPTSDFASAILAHRLPDHGYPELRELAEASLKQDTPNSPLATFAKQHGPLPSDQQKLAASEFIQWARAELIALQIERLKSSPYDRENIGELKVSLGMR